MILIKTPEQIAKMRVSGQVVAQVLRILESKVAPGITTAYLNQIAEEECRKRGAYPVFKNYPNYRGGRPFPGAICASVNDEVVHGIPSERKLKEGEIISIDFGVIVEGFAGDSAITVAVGEVDREVEKLINTTREALMRGIKQAKAGNRLGMVSNAVQNHAEKNGFSVVREFVGHGIGAEMHEDPPIPNFGRPDRGPVLKNGMALAIEPMVNMGSKDVYVSRDEWTVLTRDGSYSAHFEHTVVVGDNEPEILTLR
ncbi:MAG TPA: type I methionyl aminopeptidase [Syntrophomonadaceae bacterium]|nr:type I methionyl aminopeptidase [Syntrophomonadaceae bacterium]HNX29521.1 type I methionyl aminopeptidase [Syntrophomonadaceae bacterium]HPR94145.1 type I methionyl aminopeptidase [Syntrophomonadaceae bacterium]